MRYSCPRHRERAAEFETSEEAQRIDTKTLHPENWRVVMPSEDEATRPDD